MKAEAPGYFETFLTIWYHISDNSIIIIIIIII
jgi:hypothetical protein